MFKFGSLAKLSFGSVGFATSECSKAVIDWDSESTNFFFECAHDFGMSSVFSSGLVSYTSVEDYAGLVLVYASCYYDPASEDAYLYPFMADFD